MPKRVKNPKTGAIEYLYTKEEKDVVEILKNKNQSGQITQPEVQDLLWKIAKILGLK